MTVGMAEWSNAPVCKTGKPGVQIPLPTPNEINEMNETGLIAANGQERLRITSTGQLIVGSFHYPSVRLDVTQWIEEQQEKEKPTPREVTDTMVKIYLES